MSNKKIVLQFQVNIFVCKFKKWKRLFSCLCTLTVALPPLLHWPCINKMTVKTREKSTSIPWHVLKCLSICENSMCSLCPSPEWCFPAPIESFLKKAVWIRAFQKNSQTNISPAEFTLCFRKYFNDWISRLFNVLHVNNCVSGMLTAIRYLVRGNCSKWKQKWSQICNTCLFFEDHRYCSILMEP